MTYILQLNHLSFQDPTQLVACARSEFLEALRAYVELNQVSPYMGTLNGQPILKHFREGSLLENFYPPFDPQMRENLVDVTTEEKWVENARIRFQKSVIALPEI